MADPHTYTPAESLIRWIAALQNRVELMDGALGDAQAEIRRLRAKLDDRVEAV